jgi:hypothetical protein
VRVPHRVTGLADLLGRVEDLRRRVVLSQVEGDSFLALGLVVLVLVVMAVSVAVLVVVVLVAGLLLVRSRLRLGVFPALVGLGRLVLLGLVFLRIVDHRHSPGTSAASPAASCSLSCS